MSGRKTTHTQMEARTTVREYAWADDQTLEETDAHTAVLSFGENAKPLTPDWFAKFSFFGEIKS